MTYGPMTKRIKKDRGSLGEVMSSYERGEARGITSGKGGTTSRSLVKKRNQAKDYAAQSPRKLDFFSKFLALQDDRFNKIKEFKTANADGFTFTEEEETKRFPNSGEVPNNKDRTGPTLSDSQMVDKIILSIREVESSGGTNTNHKQVKFGMYAGQTAMGEWAIMPGNIDPTLNTKGTKSRKDSWINFKEFKEMFPEITADARGLELLKKNTKAQRLIVKNQVTKNLSRTSDPAEVASIWFTGKKRKDAGKVKDDTGTTLPTYLNKFNSAMGEL